ncbi:MAG TPA: DUF5916 domain-containing protein [Bacteroidota bacterium]|nr:DUF5916 domain-containing protein [Bacteroidota bacterium]
MNGLKLLVLIGVCATASFAQQPFRLPRVDGPITLDGHSNERAWEKIEPLPLTVLAPTYRGTAINKTEVRVGYDDDFLYVSGRCYDADPSGILVTSLSRDGISPTDDSFGIVLDTFNDNENGLAFLTNAGGLREDWAIFNDAEPLLSPFPFNSSWNTFWDVATSLTDEGWFVEMRIPFSSLRFESKNNRTVMGMIVWRYNARKNEVVTFPDVPPKSDWAVIKPSLAEDVLLEGIVSRNPLYFTPYLLGGLGMNAELTSDSTLYRNSRTTEREIGFDLKYSLTSNLTLDLTANTDFAQVEADDQQVNLTRFSLFFPEKRLFFQERSSIFDVGMGGPNRLFYSRRIGLSEEGPVRIYGGARLVGRVGDWDLGFLDMHTEKSIDLPSENFGVLRLRRQILNEYSYAGLLATSRVGNDGSYNYTYGLDGIVRVSGDDYLLLNWAQTFDDEVVRAKQNTLMNVARVRLQAERRSSLGFGYELSYSYAGEHFDPAMGFAPRTNYWRLGDRLFYGWRPGKDSPFQSLVVTMFANAFWNKRTGVVESSEIGPQWSAYFKSGAFVQVSARLFSEELTELFELSDEVSVPIGRYNFSTISGVFQSPYGSAVRTGLSLEAGTFYDGNRFTIGLSPGWSVSKHLDFTLEYQYNNVRFPTRAQTFEAHIGRLRIKSNLSTQLSSIAFVQTNTAAHSVVLNFRLRYNPREGNDFYFVYNEGLNTSRFREIPTLPAIDNRAILLKYTYTFEL